MTKRAITVVGVGLGALGLFLLVRRATAAPEPKGNLVGVVFDDTTGEYLENALVVLNSHFRRTDGFGYFEFVNLPIGDYSIVVSKVGYADYRETFTLLEGENGLNAYLTPL